MASYTILEDFHVHPIDGFLRKAEISKGSLYHTTVRPNAKSFQNRCLKKGDSLVIDFSEYCVGQLHLKFSYSGSHPDAPAYIRLHMAERIQDIDASAQGYNGWLGKGWLQEEYVHLDVLPCQLDMPRRYAFRFLKLEILGTSEKYSLTIEDIWCEHTTSANPEKHCDIAWERLSANYGLSEQQTQLLQRIDAVSLKTLSCCMQEVFEDGPKRDRRMWLGDLRLQAKVNHQTFQNEALVKRSLYLFAGLPFNEGKIAANLFMAPSPMPDDTYLMDYSLMFGATLYEYYEATGDEETLRELYPTVKQQTHIAYSNLNAEGILPDHSGEFWCFIDWGEQLNTQAASLAALIYGMGYDCKIARIVGEENRATELEPIMEKLRTHARAWFYDDSLGLFVSGNDRQISIATQVWMILAKVVDAAQGRQILNALEHYSGFTVGMQSPYMYHYYLEALMQIGDREKVLSVLLDYWGGMVALGADTFWEVYDPTDCQCSPYEDPAMNSYCHAWSCTPAYYLRNMEE